MTREEAIQVLSMVEAHGTLVIQAKEMAIEALKQEPCKDCQYKEWLEGEDLPQEPICPSAGVDCEDCPAHEKKSEWQQDHEILKAYSDGANEVLDKIKAEIEQTEINGHIRDVECFRAGINVALNVIDKHKAESEG